MTTAALPAAEEIPSTQSCRNCGLATTVDERLAVTCNAEKCPACGGYVGDDQNCRVGGGGCGK